MPEEIPRLVVGRVERPHGLAGEVAVSIATDFPQRFAPGVELLWQKGGEQRALRIANARPHAGRMLIAFEGVEDAGAARALGGGDLLVAAAEAFPPPPDFFYSHEIREFACEDPRGRALGRATGLESSPAGPLLSVETRPGKIALVPFVRGIVLSVDRAARRIVLDPPEGLLELAEE
jgi:16S rRNA processing protein RimM